MPLDDVIIPGDYREQANWDVERSHPVAVQHRSDRNPVRFKQI